MYCEFFALDLTIQDTFTPADMGVIGMNSKNTNGTKMGCRCFHHCFCIVFCQETIDSGQTEEYF